LYPFIKIHQVTNKQSSQHSPQWEPHFSSIDEAYSKLTFTVVTEARVEIRVPQCM